MKKILSLLSAIALVGIVSCDKPKMNPDYNAETDEVLTQFVLNVSTGETPETKMTAENVQKDGGFLGMQDVKMFTFETNDISPVYVTNTNTFKKLYDLGTLYASGTVKPDQNLTNRILQLSVPVGVNSVLLYGRAPYSAPADDGKDYFENARLQYGKQRGATYITVPNSDPITVTSGTTATGTYFDVARRLLSAANLEDYNATGALMIYVINTIMATKIEAMSANATAYQGYTELPALSWKNIGHKYMADNWDELKVKPAATLNDFKTAHPDYAAGFMVQDPANPQQTIERALLPLEEVIGNTYYLFTAMTPTILNDTANPGVAASVGEYRAGSSSAVKSMMESMYSMITKAINSTPTSAEEANAMRLAAQIGDVMDDYFNQDWTYKSPTTFKSKILPADWTDGNFDRARDLNKYPYEDFGVPEGAAQLTFNHNTDKFAYMNPNKPLVNQSAKSFDPNKYVFPPELMYYVNSGLRTTDNEVSASDYPNGVSNWNDVTTSGNKWDAKNWVANLKVTSSTRGIAVRDNINYGVALLKTSVGWSEQAVSNGLYDNKSSDHKAFTVGDNGTANFTLKGILVGGVNPRYDWQYLPITRNNTTEEPNRFGSFDGVIYDDNIVDASIPTPANKETYTLVYDNYNRDKDAANQNDVYITLEFVNNGDAFWGRDNVIPAGGTFYLVAHLYPAGHASHNNSASDNVSWDPNYQIPPTYGVTKKSDGTLVASATDNYKAGTSIEIPRVFMQNYMTTARFKIGMTSLKNAYYSVPDLKSAQLSVGLSVDISWNNGYTYDLEF